MSSHAAQLREQELFSALKSQITSLATPLYGTRSEDASKVYDVVSYSMPCENNDFEEELPQPRFGVAIILYTGPPASPFTSWTLISHVEDQPDIITGANFLLADLRRAMGGVIGVCMQTGNWTTTHERIPNVASGAGEVAKREFEDGEEGEEYEVDQDSVEQDDEGGTTEEESEELEKSSKGGWSPSLESIIEEI